LAKLTKDEKVELPTGDVDSTYNADGQRVKKETSTDIVKFIFDVNKLLQEADDTNNPLVEYTATLDQFGDLISDFDESAAESSYYQFDALGSTAAQLDPDGAVTDQRQYKAFGLQSQHTGASDTPFTYVGQQNYFHDSESELYILGMGGNPSQSPGIYDPSTGRFLRKDPLDTDPNRYPYVGNNPVNAVDPSGEQETEAEQLKQQILEDAEKYQQKIDEITGATEKQRIDALRESFVEAFMEDAAAPGFTSAFPSHYVEASRQYAKTIAAGMTEAELLDEIRQLQVAAERRELRQMAEEAERGFLNSPEFADAERSTIAQLQNVSASNDLDPREEVIHLTWPDWFSRSEMQKLVGAGIATKGQVGASSIRVIAEPMQKGTIYRIYDECLNTGGGVELQYRFKGAVTDATDAKDAEFKILKQAAAEAKAKGLAVAYLIPGVAAIHSATQNNWKEAIAYGISDAFLLAGWIAKAAKASKTAYGLAAGSVVYDAGLGIASGFAAYNSFTQEKYWQGTGEAARGALSVLLAVLSARHLVKNWKP
jgi:RHS repeat-associated protein